MLSVTPGSISLVSVHQTERETDFIYCCTTSHLFIISFHILLAGSPILNIKKGIAVVELHAFETIIILSLVAMETAAIFPYSLQMLQFLFLHCYRSIAMFEEFQCKIIRTSETWINFDCHHAQPKCRGVFCLSQVLFVMAFYRIQHC
ncbi:hypothetical protein T03_6186 [Trichinella britovi]|uniref:Uncharacterized protein n=1 Tax=Trichinella britovi TaxID=45882 RepID=A0A0V1CED7_TRIBR|nr:hypothetical protein T03_6186 [Trichinella britovi]